MRVGRYRLEIIVFITGAMVMILELTGSRVVAPYFGTSLFVWTSLIGIILASLSLGYYLGGKFADKNPNYKSFSTIIFASGISVGLIAVFKSIILVTVQNITSDVRAGSVTAALILFALPSVFFGMVSPYAVRLKIKDLKKSGRTVGNLYAISTMGSIIGTFLTGFLLIPFLGNTKILLGISFVLVLTALVAYSRYLNRTIFALLVICVGIGVVSQIQELRTKQGLIDVDTKYNRVWIYDSKFDKTNERIRVLQIDPLTVQSAMYLDSDNLVFDYLKFYDLATYFNPNIKNALVVGGAAYSYPKYAITKYPKLNVDVVEIDEQITLLAQKYFRLENNPRLTIYHEDGRTFLNRNEKKYDAILMDAFSSSYSVPFQLTTVEATRDIYEMLNVDGVVMVNLISAVEGDKGKFFRAEYATYKKIFPQVYVFLVNNVNDPFQVQNIMIVGQKNQTVASFAGDDGFRELFGHLYMKEIIVEEPILTDDFSPVDQYMMSAIGKLRS